MVVRMPGGGVRVLSKGADTTMVPLLRDETPEVRLSCTRFVFWQVFWVSIACREAFFLQHMYICDTSIHLSLNIYYICCRELVEGVGGRRGEFFINVIIFRCGTVCVIQ